MSFINYQYYGSFIVNDFTSKEFKDAYGALTRVKQEHYIKRVPLNEETRRKLYELSPKFRMLEGYLEGEGKKNIHKDTKDYNDGFLWWAIREGVEKLGYYENPEKANQFYTELADEINEICDSGKIESYPKRSSLVAPFQPELTEDFYQYMLETFKIQLTYKNVKVKIPFRENTDVFANELITSNQATYKNDGNLIQLSIMELILRIYQLTNLFMMFLSVGCYLVLMIQFLIKKYRFQNYKQIFLLNGLFCIYLVRIVTVAYVATAQTTGAVAKCQYLANIYPVQSIFCVLSIMFTIQEIKKIWESKKNIKQ